MQVSKTLSLRVEIVTVRYIRLTLSKAHPPQPVPASPVAAPLPDPVVIPDAKPEEAASAPAPSIHTDSAWTAEQDKVFLDMKDQKHATWKEIGSALKRGKGELKLRYKLLKNASEGQNAPEADEEPKEDSPHKKDKISKKDGKKKAEEPGLNYDFGDSEQWGRQEGEEIDLTCNWAADLWDARPNEDLLEPMQDENEGPDTGPSIRPIIKVEAGTELSLDEVGLPFATPGLVGNREADVEHRSCTSTVHTSSMRNSSGRRLLPSSSIRLGSVSRRRS